jgi:hypothetical protein
VTVTNDQLVQLLAELDRRLAAVAAHGQKAFEQAEKTLAQVNALREEVARMRKAVIASTDTQEFTPALPPRKPGRK